MSWELVMSPYLLAIASGWIVAQGSKYIFASLRDRDFSNLRKLYLSGNMPSAHSATSMALVTVVGLRDGFESAIFGVAALAASIAMYDAMMVRRSVGEQGLAIQEMIKTAKIKVLLPRSAKGHTPLEVLVGAIIGTGIGLVVYIATK